MLDQSDQPISQWRGDPNTNAMYAGSHALYQDVAVPLSFKGFGQAFDVLAKN